jgi:hypothetical protein
MPAGIYKVTKVVITGIFLLPLSFVLFCFVYGAGGVTHGRMPWIQTPVLPKFFFLTYFDFLS